MWVVAIWPSETPPVAVKLGHPPRRTGTPAGVEDHRFTIWPSEAPLSARSLPSTSPDTHVVSNQRKKLAFAIRLRIQSRRKQPSGRGTRSKHLEDPRQRSASVTILGGFTSMRAGEAHGRHHARGSQCAIAHQWEPAWQPEQARVTPRKQTHPGRSSIVGVPGGRLAATTVIKI